MIDTYLGDTDNRRKEIMWLALALLAALGITLFALLYLSNALPMRSYDDLVMTFGLVAFLGCAITYFAAKEREQRQLNQSLVASLQDAVRELNDRTAKMSDLSAANSRLDETLERVKVELDKSYVGTLRALMSTLDARDGYTALHGEQVTAIALQIARRIGMESSAVELIERFGPLHDIGRIGIPDHIHHKTDPLTEDELSLCLQHPVMGATIIFPLRPCPEAVAIVRAHHERWDGAGYPDGLAGPQIPLVARIMAVADAYHAIISERPYRAAREPMAAVREMMAESAKQFDPDVVGVLAQLAFEGILEARGAD